GGGRSESADGGFGRCVCGGGESAAGVDGDLATERYGGRGLSDDRAAVVAAAGCGARQRGAGGVTSADAAAPARRAGRGAGGGRAVSGGAFRRSWGVGRPTGRRRRLGTVNLTGCGAAGRVGVREANRWPRPGGGR